MGRSNGLSLSRADRTESGVGLAEAKRNERQLPVNLEECKDQCISWKRIVAIGRNPWEWKRSQDSDKERAAKIPKSNPFV